MAARRTVPPSACSTCSAVTAAVGAHHYFVEAPGHKHLTTQINLAGDEYTYDDFAFATRDELRWMRTGWNTPPGALPV